MHSLFTDYINTFPVLVKLMWLVSAISLLVISILVVYLFVLRYKLKLDEESGTRFRNKYEKLIVDYLYSGIEPNKNELLQNQITREFSQIIHNKSRRRLLISTLFNIQRYISGELAMEGQKLYNDLGLARFAMTKLESNNWGTKVKGIRELMIMQIKEADPVITELLDHPVPEVRTEAQLYKLRIFQNEGMNFLDTVQTPISEWQQIQLLDVIQHFEKHKIPDIRNWLQSSNATVVDFALKLAKLYNLVDVKHELIKVINHQDRKIRIKVIKVIGELAIKEAKDYLKIDFEKRSSPEKLEIIKALSAIGSEDDKSFLLNATKNDDFNTRLWAMRSLKDIFPNTALERKFRDQHPGQQALMEYVLYKEQS